MAWLVPEDKMGREQNEFLSEMAKYSSNNWWIKGFAGSGKSVLLAYSAKMFLSRDPKAKLILVVFTRSLIEMYKEAFEEMKVSIPICTYYDFCRSYEEYDCILCDEVQDLTPSVLEAMRERGTQVVVSGDSNQSIFDVDPKWREKTVDASRIGTLINGSTFELTVIYRLSQSIINAIGKLMPTMQVFAAKRDMSKKDTEIRLYNSTSESKEVEYVMKESTKAVDRGYTAAVLLPTHNAIMSFANNALRNAGSSPWVPELNRYGKPDFGSLNSYLEKCGVNLRLVGNGYGSFSNSTTKVTMMTFHSSKGLDFDRVFIPFASQQMFISYNESLAKTLFMVAMTRAREELYISYTGYPLGYLQCFSENCVRVSSQTSSQSVNAFGF